jgi:hypothetical protein
MPSPRRGARFSAEARLVACPEAGESPQAPNLRIASELPVIREAGYDLSQTGLRQVTTKLPQPN